MDQVICYSASRGSLYLQNFSETSAHEIETTSGAVSININVQTLDPVLDQ